MTAWRLVPITNGYHILTRVFADTVLVGELTLRREDYGDLAARLGAEQAFDTATGRPIPVSSVEPAPNAADQIVTRLATAVGWDLWEPDGPDPVDEAIRIITEIRAARVHACDRFCDEGGCDFDTDGFIRAVDRILSSTPDIEPDLHELHPQPGEAPAAPVPPGVEGWTPSHATPAPPGPIAPHGCDDCCAEPGEPHGWPGCSGITAGEAGERTDDLDVPPRTFPDPSYREPDGGGVA
jgi:hypothetical protein